MFFKDPKDPSMNELIHWFQVKFTDLANDMKASNHHAEPHEPNPYHIEDSIWTHTMMVCLQAENFGGGKINRICALLHDTGKPESREVIPFDARKPVHTESNELRNNGKDDGKHSGLNKLPNRELKTHFRGHEGLSFYKSMDVLRELKNECVVTDGEISEILTIISLHGTLFDNIKDGVEFKPEKVYEKWVRVPEIFESFVQQVKFDSLGRFFTSKDGRKSSAYDLGDSIFGPDFTRPMWNEAHKTRIVGDKHVTVLVGVPNVGKSTWMDNNVGEDDIVISRDKTLMEFGQLKYGTEMCTKCNGAKDVGCDCHQGKVKLTYGDVWKLFNDDDQKQVDRMIRSQYEIALKSGLNVFIDMTNTSKKSRRKWLSQLPNGYERRAVVFATGYEEILKRNKLRGDTEGKFIHPNIIHNMMKAFLVPMFDEVDDLSWAL